MADTDDDSTEQERKEFITKVTGGLKCRCPGFQEMHRIEFKPFNGVRYGYFACSDPGSTTETRYPVGYPMLCRCGLGTRPSYVAARYHEEGNTMWGMATCSDIPPQHSQVPESTIAQKEADDEAWRKQSAPLWPWLIGAGALYWYLSR